MNSFFQRALTGLLYGLIVFAAVWWRLESFAGLLIIVYILCMMEFFRLYKRIIRRPFANLKNMALLLAGFLYITLPFCLLFLTGVRNGEYFHYHPEIILGFFILVWSNDTFAYLTGSLTGKHLLMPAVSPQKTWEGVAGGMLFTLTAGWILGIFFTSILWHDWMAFALIVVVFGTLGDLVQSAFKRSAGVKDSGNILPGHGGMLDRFDAVLMAAPFVYVYLEITYGM